MIEEIQSGDHHKVVKTNEDPAFIKDLEREAETMAQQEWERFKVSKESAEVKSKILRDKEALA